MKICVISSNTKSLMTFRKDMMLDFLELGHQVTAIGDEAEIAWKSKFNEFGIEYRQIRIERNGINPIKDLYTLKDLIDLLRKERPNKIFAYQAKPVIYGSIAATMCGIRDIYLLLAGLGSLIRNDNLNLLKSLLLFEYKIACKISTSVFFHNIDDCQYLVEKKVVSKEKSKILNGSGVNLNDFKPSPLPVKPTFLFIGRLIRDKGIVEYLEACRKVKTLQEVRCLLVGPFDTNPTSLKKEDVEPFIKSGVVEYFGEQVDVRPFISMCTTLVLPSYHEGTPKTILEAMAMGRSIITTDAPGCRETVNNYENGFIVPVRDTDSLVEKMLILSKNAELRELMGKNSLLKAIAKYDVRKVNQEIIRTMRLI